MVLRLELFHALETLKPFWNLVKDFLQAPFRAVRTGPSSATSFATSSPSTQDSEYSSWSLQIVLITLPYRQYLPEVAPLHLVQGPHSLAAAPAPRAAAAKLEAAANGGPLQSVSKRKPPPNRRI